MSADSVNAAQASTPGKPAPAPSAARGPLLLVVVLLALAAGGYLALHKLLLPRLDDALSGVQALNQRVEELAARASAQEARLAAADERAAQASANVAALRTRQDETAETVRTLAVQTGGRVQDLTLAEIEYLLELGSQRLALARDVGAARSAVAAASARLAGLPPQPALAAALEHDTAALAAVAEPDIAALALNLAGLAARVEQLPTKPVGAEQSAFAATAHEPVALDNWRGLLHAMWKDLLSLVEIKETALPDNVLFDPKLRYFLQQNLKLELAGARLALFARDQANFRADLEALAGQLERYYDTTDPQVKAALDQLAVARNLDFTPALPSLQASLDAVRASRQAAGPAGTP